jgi:hypothetical protein
MAVGPHAAYRQPDVALGQNRVGNVYANGIACRAIGYIVAMGRLFLYLYALG